MLFELEKNCAHASVLRIYCKTNVKAIHKTTRDDPRDDPGVVEVRFRKFVEAALPPKPNFVEV